MDEISRKSKTVCKLLKISTKNEMAAFLFDLGTWHQEIRFCVKVCCTWVLTFVYIGKTNQKGWNLRGYVI